MRPEGRVVGGVRFALPLWRVGVSGVLAKVEKSYSRLVVRQLRYCKFERREGQSSQGANKDKAA